jgi:hypothetical protein
MSDAIIIIKGNTQMRKGVENRNSLSNFQPIARNMPIEMKNWEAKPI